MEELNPLRPADRPQFLSFQRARGERGASRREAEREEPREDQGARPDRASKSSTRMQNGPPAL
jgi:hypothetical protein